jgi:hypothetical protein
VPLSITGRIRAARPSSRTHLCSQVLEFAPFAVGFILYKTIFPETDALVKGFWLEGLPPLPETSQSVPVPDGTGGGASAKCGKQTMVLY